MGEPTATHVKLTLPPGITSWLVGGMENLGGTLRTTHGDKARVAGKKSIDRRCRFFLLMASPHMTLAGWVSTGSRENGLLIAVQKVQASTMGRMGLSQNEPGNSRENLEGVF